LPDDFKNWNDFTAEEAEIDPNMAKSASRFSYVCAVIQ
jgi:hypothetical protein